MRILHHDRGSDLIVDLFTFRGRVLVLSLGSSGVHLFRESSEV